LAPVAAVPFLATQWEVAEQWQWEGSWQEQLWWQQLWVFSHYCFSLGRLGWPSRTQIILPAGNESPLEECLFHCLISFSIFGALSGRLRAIRCVRVGEGIGGSVHAHVV